VRTLYEMVREVRGVAKEKSAALIHDSEILSWINEEAAELARESMCFRREWIFPAKSNQQLYDLPDIIPGYLDKLQMVWYRDRELRLIDTKFTGYSLVLPTTSLPVAYFFDASRFGLWQRPTVVEYSTGTATFTRGLAVVTFAGGADLVAAGIAAGFAIGRTSDPTRYRRVLSVESATSLTMEGTWDEDTAAGSAFVITDGAVRVWYVGLPDPVLLVRETTGTATFTQNSPTVTGPVTNLWTKKLRPGQWIGKGKQFSAEPSRFYRIKSVVGDGEVTLDQQYREETAAAAFYIATDPVPLNYGDATAVLYFAMTRAYGRYGNARMMQVYEQKHQAERLKVQKEAVRRYVLTEGHQVREVDAGDQMMWSGLGGW